MFKKNTCLKTRINQNPEKHHFHNKFDYCVIEAK